MVSNIWVLGTFNALLKINENKTNEKKEGRVLFISVYLLKLPY